MTGRARHCLLLALLALSGCQGVDRAALAPEAAVAACLGPVTLALRANDPGLASVDLAPAAASRVERRGTAVGRQPVSLLVAGGGAAGTAGATRPVRYLCLLDPQGRAIHHALTGLGFAGVRDVRAGKMIELDLDEGVGREQVEDMCRRLLANTVIENFRIEGEAGSASA